MAAQRPHSVPAHLRKKKPGHAAAAAPGPNCGRAGDEAFDGADHSSRDASEVRVWCAV
jgi:hypothetical protein